MKMTFGGVMGLFTVVLMTIGLGLFGCPQYNVWSAKKAGEAELAQADQNRQIQVAQSKAKFEAASFEAQAEVARAQGVAQANKIIGNSLTGEEGANYLRYLWINNLGDQSHERTVVYVPTEGTLPQFLEAGRIGANNIPQPTTPPASK